MATRSNPNNGGLKPSFASIAAMAPTRENERPLANHNYKERSLAAKVLKDPPGSSLTKPLLNAQVNGELEGRMLNLELKDGSAKYGGINGRDISATRPMAGTDDDQTQVSSSSTKPASLDGKSVTSGTTFALDEKESLRPDDSASVKAADEEDTYSGPASGAPSSRVGSEAGGRAFRDQFYEISERIGPQMYRSAPIGRKGIPGIEEEGPQGTLAPLASAAPVPPILPGQEVAQNGHVSFEFNYQDPDEKLLEALDSPKDRLFLLRLEQDVILFIKDSKEPILDLPPCNSFCRLLAHKLADYYALTHFVDNAVSAVRLYRTPYCRLRTPLSVISNPATNESTPPLVLPAMKIMQRAGLGKDIQKNGSGENTTASSIAQSKAGSDAGEDSLASPTDPNAPKDKSALTREEREAKYKETRERIFKDFEDTESPDDTGLDIANQVSRESSTTGKKNKKKHKTNDDGFEARSQFNAYYPAMQYSGPAYEHGMNATTYYNSCPPQQGAITGQPGVSSIGMIPQQYGQSFPQIPNYAGYTMPLQQIPVPNGLNYGQNNALPPGFPQQIPPGPPQYFQSPQQQNPMGQQASTMSSPALSNSAQLSRPQSQMSDQQWLQSSYPSQYQMSGNQHRAYQAQNQNGPSPIGLPVMPTVSYPYGQLPYQPNVPGGRPQHPLPGSYNRQTFNPQTRSFVPGNNFPSPQQNMPMSEQSPSFINRSTFPQYPNSYFPTATIPPIYPFPHETRNHGSSRKASGAPPQHQSPVQNSLAKWGTPAHLPPKPPPPEVPSMPEAQHSLPANVHTGMNPQAIVNTQGLGIQNGTPAMR